VEIRFKVIDEAASTQDLVRDAAVRGEPEGLAIMAVRQTSGRGRYGRSWISPPERNLALSLLLRPKLGPADAAMLGMIASIAVAQAVEEHGIAQAQLKWPNDVTVTGKKIAGILPEARVTGAVVDYVILGIGINVNAVLTDFPPELRELVTSIVLETGRESHLEIVAQSVLGQMERIYGRVIREGVRFAVDLWQARWAHRGAVLQRNGLAGRAEGLDVDGALLLRAQDGTLHRIHAGEAHPV